MAESDLPDAMTMLAAAAAVQHELFTTYVEAGFSRSESLQIVVAIIVAGIQRGTG